MGKVATDPRIDVRQRVDVTLSRAEVEHALRCWIAHQLAKGEQVPEPASFSDIVIYFDTDETSLLSVTATYAPRSPSVEGKDVLP